MPMYNQPVYFFDKIATFSPIVKPREFIRLIPLKRYLQVLHVSPIGLITKDFGSLATVTSGAKTEMETEMKLEDSQLGQFRFWLEDGFRLSIFHPQAQQVLGTKDSLSYLYKNNPVYSAFDRDNSADTEVSLWVTTSGKTAKIVRMQIDNETANAQSIRLGDGSGVTDAAEVANADWSVEIGASQSLTFTGSECPLKEFSTGIVWEHSVAQQIRISIDVLETGYEQPYGRDVAEMFVYGDDAPYFETYNPTGITLNNTRVHMLGWKYEVKEVDKGDVNNFTDVPYRAYTSML